MIKHCERSIGWLCEAPQMTKLRGQWGVTIDVRPGSKCEKLTTGKSSPLCPTKRTSTRGVATSLMGQYRQSRDIRSPHRRRRAGLADGKVQRLGGAKIKFQIEFELSHTALLSAVRFVRLAWRLALAARALCFWTSRRA